MNKVLIIGNKDGADEFDIFGFEIIDIEIFNNLLTLLGHLKKDNPKLYEETDEYCFGTNEFMGLSYSDLHDVLLNSRLISDDDFNTIQRLFGKRTWDGSYGITFTEQMTESLYYHANEYNLKIGKDE